jgi:hypothetical protein
MISLTFMVLSCSWLGARDPAQDLDAHGGEQDRRREADEGEQKDEP